MRFSVFVLSALALLSGLPAHATPPQKLTLAECWLPKLDSAARCGKLMVPESPGNNDKMLAIHVAVLPAAARTPRSDPLFLLAGGPGEAASNLAPVAQALAGIRKERDIVLVDQRGTGRSPTLHCEDPGAKDPLAALLGQIDAEAAIQRCLASLKGNPAAHTTLDYLRDVDAARSALGYLRINLWGGSYGSRVALEYMKRYPQQVRSVILDGVAPTSVAVPLDLVAHNEASLKAVFADCQKQTACRQAQPEGYAGLLRWLDQLDQQPLAVRFSHPATGKPLAGKIHRASVAAALQPLLYLPETTALIPRLIEQAKAGDVAPLFAMAFEAQSKIGEQIGSEMRLAVLCAEDFQQQRDHAAIRAANPVFGGMASEFASTCQRFPHGKAPPDQFRPTVSSIPTLLLSGGMDPVTPPAMAEMARKTLSNSRHIVLPNYGHIVSPYRCMPKLLATFIDEAGFGKLSEDCVRDLTRAPRPPAYISTLEARP